MFCFQGITDSEVQNAELPVPKKLSSDFIYDENMLEPREKKKTNISNIKKKIKSFSLPTCR